MRCLARLMRLAMVSSGTRNARGDLGGGQAADRAQGQRDRRARAPATGWQHRNSSGSESSALDGSRRRGWFAGGGQVLAVAPGVRRRATGRSAGGPRR